eukprot:259732_1
MAPYDDFYFFREPMRPCVDSWIHGNYRVIHIQNHQRLLRLIVNINRDRCQLLKSRTKETACAQPNIFAPRHRLKSVANKYVIVATIAIETIYLPVAAVNADLSYIKVEEWKKKYLPHYVELNRIYWEGHRTAVRSLSLSSDDSMIASTCKNELKIWNTRSMRCIRNLPCEYGLKCMFAPANKHVIVATKQGNILIYDLVQNSNEMIDWCIGHEELLVLHPDDGEVWSLWCMDINSSGQLLALVSSGGDRSFRMWLESNEPLFPLHQEQKELESLFDAYADLINNNSNITAIEGSGLINKNTIESHKGSKKTMSAIECGESLMEAIQLCDNDMEKRTFFKDKDKEYVMNARLRVGGCESLEQYMFHRLEAIPTCDLEEVLMILPAEYLQSIFYYLEYCIKNSKQIEKMIRCVLFLVKYHHQQLQ